MERCSHRDASGTNRHDAERHDLVVQVVEARRLEMERGERGRPPRATSQASTWRARKLGGHTHLRWVKAELEGECALDAVDQERRLHAPPRHESELLRIDVVVGRLPSSSCGPRERSCVQSFRTFTQASIVAASGTRNPHVLLLRARPNLPVYAPAAFGDVLMMRGRQRHGRRWRGRRLALRWEVQPPPRVRGRRLWQRFPLRRAGLRRLLHRRGRHDLRM